MRREVTKYLFVGPEEDRETFFAEAQKAGVIEFIDPGTVEPLELPTNLSCLIAAKKVLRHLEPLPQKEPDDPAEAGRIACQIVDLEQTIERLGEEKRLLGQEIARVQVFGDFSMDDLRTLQEEGKRTLQFLFTHHGSHPESALLDEVIYVDTAYDLDYYVAVNKERQEYPDLIEMHIERPVGELRQRLQEVDHELHAAELQLRDCAKWKSFIHHALIEQWNAFNLQATRVRVEKGLDQRVFAVQAWVPSHKVPAVEKMMKGLSIWVDQIAIEKKDRVPTYLENKGLARVGEDIVHIYDTPSNEDRDPSRWVLWFFALFFGMIVNDAGYGILLLIPSLWLFFKFGKRIDLTGRFSKLCLIIAGACCIVGIFTGTFFGISLSPENPLYKYSLTGHLTRAKVAYALENKGIIYRDWVEKYPALAEKTTVDEWLTTAVRKSGGSLTYDLADRFADNIMLELAIIVGIIHLILAFLRMIDLNWAGAGWILFLIGSYLFFPSILQAHSLLYYYVQVDYATGVQDGLWLIWVGIGSAVVLALIQNRLRGLGEITNLIQVFADGLSYLRLYALGLAGAMMASTFNEMARSAGVLFGIPIIILGHSVNIALALMGGVIHGLRLNFLEWYRHCFEGGGRRFRPLELLKIYNP